ncbi:heparinase II/III family protein [Sphingomonas sp. LaA6.9]|uniref:heparinase II/III family protein n=1 Tax=Sphingomonas sp. LaA6.9 TaxID=2919914 RepID=UPI001F4F3F71|nr:heparinase II/III family protein [Sphingomonas sp. LaA6.9]MCJ8156309.1 heparinase II/III family protein [Sphingomonas sp. LaA6.9]
MTIESPLDAAADGIEQGKRLVRIGGDKGLSLAERIANRLLRLTWRSPLHALRLKGRYPLKLLAVPDDPVVGDVKAGQALLSGHFLYRGEKLELKTLDFAKLDASDGMARYIHSFQWLRDLSTVATREQGAPIAERVMRKWTARHAEQVSDLAWRPSLWGKRILFWTAHAPLILSSSDLVYRSTVLNSLARGTRHLDRGADKAEQGVPRIAAWAGLAAAGLLIPGDGKRRENAEAGLARALTTGMSSDGGVICRSPSGQLELVMLLSMLRAVYDARRQQSPVALEAALAQAVPALLGITHGDGGLASWQGSAPWPAERVQAVIEASGVRTRPQPQARDWGYQRMAAGHSIVIVDAAPPPLSRLNVGGCASTLAFEMSDGAHRLIVSCGGSRETSAHIPAKLAHGLRSTAAHSTLVVHDNNSTAIHNDGSLGRGVTEVEMHRQESDAGSRLDSSHDGYARRFGLIHKRKLSLSADGRELAGEDTLNPAPVRRRPAQTPFAVRFHLAPGVEVSSTADGLGAVLRIAHGPIWQFRCRGGMLAVEDSLWVDAEGRPHPTVQLVVSAEAAGSATVNWVLKRAG